MTTILVTIFIKQFILQLLFYEQVFSQFGQKWYHKKFSINGLPIIETAFMSDKTSILKCSSLGSVTELQCFSQTKSPSLWDKKALKSCQSVLLMNRHIFTPIVTDVNKSSGHYRNGSGLSGFSWTQRLCMLVTPACSLSTFNTDTAPAMPLKGTVHPKINSLSIFIPPCAMTKSLRC